MASIVRITRKRIASERLFNLAVAEDESYIAEGVVVHNCKSYLEPNIVGQKNPELSPVGLRPTGTEAEIAKAEAAISLADGVPESLQSIIVFKSAAKTVDEARKIALRIDAEARVDKVDETSDSWRFRQADPDAFARLRTKKIEPLGVSLIVGPRK